MNSVKIDLGIMLYNEVSALVARRNESQLFLNFEEEKLVQVENIFNKYKNSEFSVQLLYVFLSYYARYNNKPWFNVNKSKMHDVVRSYGFTDLVAEKYRNRRVLL
jgi:hypothetical protein